MAIGDPADTDMVTTMAIIIDTHTDIVQDIEQDTMPEAGTPIIVPLHIQAVREPPTMYITTGHRE